MLLAQKHPHSRDTRITFDETCHVYTIDGSSKNVISVTTLIHSHFPRFNPDEVIKGMRKKGLADKYKDMSDAQIKQLWSENGKIASGRGTKLHKRIENFYNEVPDEPCELTDTPFGYFLNFHETIKDRLEPYRTEWSIFRDDIKLAGQLDMLYKVKGSDCEYALYDWKCVQEIKLENRFEKGNGKLNHLDHCNYNHYSIQLNVYKRLLETLYNLSIVEMFLVILHPDNDTYQLVKVEDMKSEIDSIFTERKKTL